MKVFVTGGAGFVGTAVIKALLAADHSVHALVNHRKLQIQNDRVTSFTGDLFNATALDSAMRGCNAVVHLVGIIAENPAKGITFDRIHFEGTVAVVEATTRAGIRRYIHMSALGAAADAASLYHRSKFRAEQFVRASALDWTILQPSLIHGPGGDFTKMEIDWARGKSLPYLFMPYFGVGLLGTGPRRKIQPVFVDDVARAFVQCLSNEKTIAQTFPLGGSQQLTWPQMHHLAAQKLTGQSRIAFPIPAWYAKAITHIVPASLLPFTHDQVLMAEQDNTCDLQKFVEAFGWTPRSFEETFQ
jgi:NADH dehydrogenase